MCLPIDPDTREPGFPEPMDECSVGTLIASIPVRKKHRLVVASNQPTARVETTCAPVSTISGAASPSWNATVGTRRPRRGTVHCRRRHSRCRESRRPAARRRPRSAVRRASRRRERRIGSRTRIVRSVTVGSGEGTDQNSGSGSSPLTGSTPIASAIASSSGFENAPSAAFSLPSASPAATRI